MAENAPPPRRRFRVLKKLAAGIAIAVAAVMAYALTLPDTFAVKRAAFIKVPASKVFPHLQDFRQWAHWSPWEKLDPALKRTYSGASAGKGAIYEWDGNDKVGRGRMEILQVVPDESLRIRLDFFKPFEAHNQAEFILMSGGDTVHVTWLMTGPNPYMAKLMQVFFSMDALVGHDFETGLENLKALVEK